MSLVGRQRWFFLAAGITLVFAGVCLSDPKPSAALTAFTDLAGLALMLVAGGICALNALSRSRPERSFWAMMVLAFLLWTSNQFAWTILEVFLDRPIPDPFFFDVVLFFHAVPMIAARLCLRWAGVSVSAGIAYNG